MALVSAGNVGKFNQNVWAKQKKKKEEKIMYIICALNT